jgi:hypothetical protein
MQKLRWYHLPRLYRRNKDFDRLIQKCLDVGIKSTYQDRHTLFVILNNGIKVEFWISNYPYAYFSSAAIHGGTGFSTFDDCVPSLKMINKLADEVNKLDIF